MRDTLRVLRWSAACGWADYRSSYSVRTWVGGWLLRVFAQVAFYAFIGRLLDDPARTAYMLIGTAVWFAAMEVGAACASTAWERRAGTLPLLVVAPTDLFWVYLGRNAQWLPSGIATSTLSLLVLSPAFHTGVPPSRLLAAVPLLALTAVASYGLALTVAAIAMRAYGARNIASNLYTGVLLVFCGVQVPLAFWPGWVGALAQAVPLTHGLAAVRAQLAGTGGLAGEIGLALLTGAAWFGIAWLIFHGAAERGRRTGSIEFGD